MRIKKLVATNAFQHSELDLSFSDFNVILGSNGSGKSSIIELIRYALIGKFMLPGTTETMIKEGETSGDLQLVVSQDGDDIDIRTKLGKTARRLTRGELKLSKSAEVLEYIENNVIRTSADIINDAAIISQGKLTAGLFASPAERFRAFMRLAGLNELENKRKLLAVEVTKCSPAVIAIDLDNTKTAIDRLTGEVIRCETKLDTIAPRLDKATLDECTNFLNNIDEAKSKLKSLAELSKEEAILVKEHEELAAITSKAKDLHNKVSKWLTAHKAAYTDAISTIARAEGYNKELQRKQKLEEKAEALLVQIDSLEPVQLLELDEEINELRNILAECTSETKHCENIINALEGADSTCPVCNGEVKDPAKILSDMQATILESREVHEQAAAELAALSSRMLENKRKHQVYTSTLENLTTQHKSLVQDNLEDIGEPIDATAAQAIVDDYNEQQQKAEEYEELLAEEEEFNKVTKRLTEVRAIIDNTVVPDMPDSDAADVIQSSREFVVEQTALLKEVNELNGELCALRKELVEHTSAYEDGLAKKERYDKIANYRETVEFARAALHRDNFPNKKVLAFIQSTIVRTNYYLDTLRAGFEVNFDPAIGFEASFLASGKSIRADRLSGGEQVIFALAFRFAVNEIKSDAGFLILDEPTAYLDENHIDSVAETLAVVKAKLSGSVQIIVVTHDEKLATIADNVLELKNV